MDRKRVAIWPRFFLRCLEQEIGNLNCKLFGEGWFHAPRAKPFRYKIIATEFERQSMTELVFEGQPPDGRLMTITCGQHPHIFIQRPCYPCLDRTINQHIIDMERMFPSMCFDITCVTHRNKT